MKRPGTVSRDGLKRRLSALAGYGEAVASELTAEQWRPRRAAHEARVDALVRPHLSRRGLGVAHPVEDFLFTYYPYRPAAIRRWHPGAGCTLTGDVGDFAAAKAYRVEDGRACLDDGLLRARHGQVEWTRRLLAATRERPPFLGCFGLHEWAMVYGQRPDEQRHTAYPLRLGREQTDAVTRSHRITCTHFDAFRFFTEPARRLNVLQPTRQDQSGHEQPGCLHAAMDCYKWAFKLAPMTPSELVVDCFELAREVRQVDMRASPYDLGSLGLEPIRIETAEGKTAYLAHQRDFAARSNELRERLISVCDTVIELTAPTHAW